MSRVMVSRSALALALQILDRNAARHNQPTMREAADELRASCRDVEPTTPAAELAALREKAAEADDLRKDAERYRKLRGWMSSNVKEGWGRVTDLSAVFCYVSWQEGDSYLDNLPECNVGLMQKDAAIAHGKGE